MKTESDAIDRINAHFDDVMGMSQNLGETLKKVIQFCEQQHPRAENFPTLVCCPCVECQTKRRVLLIISDNLK